MKTINNIINFKSLATSINAAYYPIYDLVTQTRFTNYFSLGLNNKGVRFFSSEIENNNKAIWKYNIKSIYINYDDFNISKFTDVLIKNLTINNTYSLLIKIQYTDIEGNILYCMLDEQIGITYYSKDDITTIIQERFEDFEDKLNHYIGKYKAVDINLIQIMYVVNNSFQNLRLKNINKESLDKNIVNVKETRKLFSNNLLPLSTNEIFYGKVLSFEVDYTKQFVSCLYVDEKDFIHLVKQLNKSKNKPYIEFESNTRFYLYTINNKQYIITVKDLEKNKTVKEVYNLSGFKIIDNIIDENLSSDRFTRKIQNVLIEFKDNTITTQNIQVKLPVFKLKHTKYTGMANPNIGTFDIETYKDLDSNSKVYALGFTNLNMIKDQKKTSMYYLTKDGNTSDEIILKCIDDMFSVKNRDHIYYTHNLGGFDIVFILKALKQANKVKGLEYYIIKTSLRDSKVLKCVVKVKTNSGYNKITFIDSYNLLTDNLDNLSKSFGSKVKKGLFPYTFVTSNTLKYKGNTPSRDYYVVKNKKITSKEYKELYKTDWCLRLETLSYLEKDLLSLLEIVSTFNKYIYIEYGIQLTESLTIARLALNIFIKRYLKDTLLPVINNTSVFSFIKKAYYGGVVEVYKAWGKNLFYYDVNSLYPFVAKNIMPGHMCEYIESKNTLNLNELFGFFYCKVKTNNGYLGLLPVHKKGLIMPNGEWYGWYFSEELKFARDNGYVIDVIKGYKFNKVNSVFNEYVDDLYKIKSSSEGSVKLITKLLLNSLLGRFGMSIFKLQTEIVSLDKYKEILSTKAINSSKSISDTDMLISFSNVISKKITKEHGLDYIEILNQKSDVDLEKTNSFDDVAISISSAVTAYARVYMGKIKLDIIRKGGQIYYSDTDSIVTDIELPENIVGNGLGQFKLEYKLKEAYFISAKTYCLVLDKNYITSGNKGIIIKSKGVYENSLNLNDFKSMYFNKKSVKAIKSDNKTNYLEGYVDIDTKEVTLNYDSYSKRQKIYDDNGLWIDTTPLVHTED